MRSLKVFGILLLVVAILAVACLSLFRFIDIDPAAIPPTAPVSATDEVPTTSEDPLSVLDSILENTVPASLAHNAPSQMKVGEVVTIELLMDPTLSEEQIREKISEPGSVFSSENILITQEMKAELASRDPEAFSIQTSRDPIQLINSQETTKWAWDVTPRKAGSQRLTIFVSRRIEYQGEERWEIVDSYNPDIPVEVAPKYPLDWRWIAAFLVLALAVFYAYRQRAGRGSRQVKQPRHLDEPAVTARQTGQPAGCVLISYRRSDSADIAGRIYDRLVEEFGPDPVFKDVDSIPLGIDFKHHLDQKVGESSVFLAIIGDQWLQAADAGGKRRLDDPEDYVRIEIESALKRGIPVIPLLVRGAQMPEEESLPESLRKLVFMNGIAIRPDPDFHNDMDRLIAAIHKYI